VTTTGEKKQQQQHRATTNRNRKKHQGRSHGGAATTALGHSEMLIRTLVMVLLSAHKFSFALRAACALRCAAANKKTHIMMQLYTHTETRDDEATSSSMRSRREAKRQQQQRQQQQQQQTNDTQDHRLTALARPDREQDSDLFVTPMDMRAACKTTSPQAGNGYLDDSDDLTAAFAIPIPRGEHVKFYGWDDLFPNTQFGLLFDTSEAFRSDLREAARRDFVLFPSSSSSSSSSATTTVAAAAAAVAVEGGGNTANDNLSEMVADEQRAKVALLNDPRSSLMSNINWLNKSNKYTHLTQVLRNNNFPLYLDGPLFIDSITSLIPKTEYNFGSWMDIVGVKDRCVSLLFAILTVMCMCTNTYTCA